NDGMHALNTAFIQDGIFIHVKRGSVVDHPVYLYNITDTRLVNILAQPRTLIYVGENVQVQFVQTYATIGTSESFTNEVVEVVVEKDAMVEYDKIKYDKTYSSKLQKTKYSKVRHRDCNSLNC